jgi:hypothetical protein
VKSKWEWNTEMDSDGKRWDEKMHDGLYDKYRVIKTADLDDLARIAEGHGERMAEMGIHEPNIGVEIVKWVEAASISGMTDEGVNGTSMVFVLRPDHDYHARVALSAYAASVVAYNPQLADDLNQALDLMEVPSSMVPD